MAGPLPARAHTTRQLRPKQPKQPRWATTHVAPMTVAELNWALTWNGDFVVADLLVRAAEPVSRPRHLPPAVITLARVPARLPLPLPPAFLLPCLLLFPLRLLQGASETCAPRRSAMRKHEMCCRHVQSMRQTAAAWASDSGKPLCSRKASPTPVSHLHPPTHPRQCALAQPQLLHTEAQAWHRSAHLL